MRRNRLTPESNPELDNRPVAELLSSLNNAQGYGKAQVLFALARRSQGEPELMHLLLNEAASLENQSTVAQFNDSVAMAAAFAIIDHGRPEDIEALKKIVDEWQNPYHSEDFYWNIKSADLTI
jgi:hypothetical protein